MSLLSRAVAKIKDALVFLSQKAAGIGQENQIMEVIHDQAGAGMCLDRVFRLSSVARLFQGSDERAGLKNLNKTTSGVLPDSGHEIATRRPNRHWIN